MIETERQKKRIVYKEKDRSIQICNETCFSPFIASFCSAASTYEIVFNGGLLCDDVGLGKTMQILMCIKLNPGQG